jgi:hypothetical protein
MIERVFLLVLVFFLFFCFVLSSFSSRDQPSSSYLFTDENPHPATYSSLAVPYHNKYNHDGHLHRRLQQQSSHRKLKVIKAANREKAVFVLDEQNVRHLIPDWSTFTSLGYDIADIIYLPPDELHALQEGVPLEAIVEEESPSNPLTECPCYSDSQHLATVKNTSINKPSYLLCFVNNSLLSSSYREEFDFLLFQRSSSASHQHHNLEVSFKLISSTYTERYYHNLFEKEKEIEKCDMLVDVIDEETSLSSTTSSLYKYECPEKCVPVPYTKLSIEWFKEDSFPFIRPDLPITCSMTWQQMISQGTELHEHHLKKNGGGGAIGGGRRTDKSGVLREITKGETNTETESTLLKETNSEGLGKRSTSFLRINSRKHRRRRLQTKKDKFLSSDASSSTLSSFSSDHHYRSLEIMLKLILQRRLEECHEKDEWKHFDALSDPVQQLEQSPSLSHASYQSEIQLHSSLNNKRAVFGLIIWVGSRTRYDVLEDQIRILTYQNLSLSSSSSLAVIAGWMASEDQYSCRPGSTICDSASSNNAYYHYMPTTRLNVASSGWACAQRRPLRAISHTLLLYDPQYLLVVDDDTFVNIKLLLHASFRRYISSVLSSKRLVLGQLTQGRKVTKKGFYFGGAGYLIGRKSIEDLNAFSIMNPRYSMTAMIDPTLMKELSLYNQILPLSQQYCPQCMKPPVNTSSDELGVTANLTIRMIDICVNIMAQEHTCYHSDHSITRCYVHGIYADPVNIECGGSWLFPSHDNENLMIGMCMGIAECSIEVQLTCHRWKANRNNVLLPVNMQQLSSPESIPSNTTTLNYDVAAL